MRETRRVFVGPAVETRSTGPYLRADLVEAGAGWSQGGRLAL